MAVVTTHAEAGLIAHADAAPHAQSRLLVGVGMCRAGREAMHPKVPTTIRVGAEETTAMATGVGGTTTEAEGGMKQLDVAGGAIHSLAHARAGAGQAPVHAHVHAPAAVHAAPTHARALPQGSVGVGRGTAGGVATRHADGAEVSLFL